MKKSILIIYSHFAPAYKAGGPVQSIVNLVNCMRDEYKLFVLCSAYDMGEQTVLEGIQPNAWNQYNDDTQVFYTTKISWSIIKKIFQVVDPEIVYINGLYTLYYSLFPHLLAMFQKRKIILAPRGMLQSGALAVKPLKKKIFFWWFKSFGFSHNVIWHATDSQEEEDIRSMFGTNAKIKRVPNIPKAPSDFRTFRVKKEGSLNLIFLSLITEKKNLHLALQTLRIIKSPVQFDIYGPVKDHSYWKKCLRLMENTEHTIRYQGPVEPGKVQAVLQQYHAFILPTKGENFGHAIYEAMMAGTVPVISQYTPWGNLQKSNAGITVANWDLDEWASAINKLMDMKQYEFDVLSSGSFQLAKTYFDENNFKMLYKDLFN